MKTLLRIDSSLRLHKSYSRRAGDDFVQQWKILNPNGQIKCREIGIYHIPHLDQTLLDAFYGSTAPSDNLNLSDQLIAELFECDDILITVPMYNFGIPSSLKAYFDLVIRTGKTFRYEDRPIGLLQGKTAYILSAMGDVSSEAPNIVALHLRQMLNYIGVEHIYHHIVDGTADAHYSAQQLNNQKKSVKDLLNQ